MLIASFAEPLRLALIYTAPRAATVKAKSGAYGWWGARERNGASCRQATVDSELWVIDRHLALMALGPDAA